MPRSVREDIRAVHTRHRSPTTAVEAHIDIQQSRHRLASWRGVGGLGVGWIGLEQCTNDEEERAHSKSGNEEGPFPASKIDEEEDEDGGHGKLDETVDTRGKEGRAVLRVTDGLED